MASSNSVSAASRSLKSRLTLGIATAPLVIALAGFSFANGLFEQDSLPPMQTHEVSEAGLLHPIAALLELNVAALLPQPEGLAAQIASPVAAAALPAPAQPEIAPQPTLPLQTELNADLAATPADEHEAQQISAYPGVLGIPADDLALVRLALGEYRKGDLAAGDAHAAGITDEAARAALEWAAIRQARQKIGFRRLAHFVQENPAFPMAEWVQRRAEEALFVERLPAQAVLAFFGARAPEMAHGKVALARAVQAEGDEARASRLVRSAWRDNRTSQSLRAVVLKDFPGVITPADHRYLAERLIYEGDVADGLRIAAGAGPAALSVVQVLAASINENGGAPALIARLDPTLMHEPAVIFARVQALRRSGKFAEAGQLMLKAPSDPARIIDGDEWWTERRMVARKLLDLGDRETAYRIAAGHTAETPAQKVDAEVHAGWIALRFLDRADTAADHFARARAAATTPASIARAAYWQGRAAEAVQDPMDAFHYLGAATHRHTFYGQLALARLGEKALPPAAEAADAQALESATQSVALRAIRILLDADARDLAQPLITDAAQKAQTAAQAMAVGDLAARYGMPRLTLLAGKLAMQRGLPAERHAFPQFGIPPFEPAGASADAPVVYSIARQESEFDPRAVSHAGARGLMQLMPATAHRTAARFKIPYDVHQLTANPALNARIGAAHLGELFGEYDGSYILSFAAYNAGGKRVKEWTTAYGDPRDPAVDKVDWIERIPITETRHYVQKVLENLQIYRARLHNDRSLGIMADLERGARPARKTLAMQTP